MGQDSPAGRPSGPAPPEANGKPPKLSPGQRARLPELLALGPSSFGFSGEIWTRQRVAQVIREQFGVTYHPAHVGRILRSCGFSLQKPALRAAQRDEEAIRDWRERRFPELKKRL